MSVNVEHYTPKKVVTVENLTVGDVATFKQDGKLAQFKRTAREKVTGVKKVNQNAVKVTTVDKGGFESVYSIPTGTDMRVHRHYFEDAPQEA